MEYVLPNKYKILANKDGLREIRIRANKPVTININGEIIKTDLVATKDDVLTCVKNACDSSVYAFVDEIKNGFITIKGGHRIGICGKVVIKDNEITNIVDFNGVNIRIAREIIGCANEIIKLMNGSTLIISPPGCGKTTILRDIARILGKKHNVSVVDERGEIASCYKGEPQFDVGDMTDVLDLCPKSIGIEMVLRGMSPRYIITDEIGRNDIDEIKKGLLCGVDFIVSAHGDSIEEVVTRLQIDRNTFKKIILLGKNAKILKVGENYGG